MKVFVEIFIKKKKKKGLKRERVHQGYELKDKGSQIKLKR
jgi:hypothetical protein